jgi:hypothetical protein
MRDPVWSPATVRAYRSASWRPRLTHGFKNPRRTRSATMSSTSRNCGTTCSIYPQKIFSRNNYIVELSTGDGPTYLGGSGPPLWITLFFKYTRRTYKVRRNDEGEAQRRKWTFYEAIMIFYNIFTGSTSTAIFTPAKDISFSAWAKTCAVKSWRTDHFFPLRRI